VNSNSRPVAAIDLGTNTALLLVARRTDRGGLEVLAERCVSTRLGQRDSAAGSDDPPLLSPAAVQRTLTALTEFKQTAETLAVNPADTRVTATAVLRRVHDAAYFVGLCAQELGLQVEILSGTEESRLGRHALGLMGPEDWISVDVGGGSTEVSIGQQGKAMSIPLGALLLSEQFFEVDSLAPQETGGAAALWEHAERGFRQLDAGLGDCRPVVLLGGSAANLACLEKKLARFEPAQVQGTRVRSAAVRAWAGRLLELTIEQRLHLPIENDRAQILPAGLVCLALALERIGARHALISSFGLRHGVALELLRRGSPPE